MWQAEALTWRICERNSGLFQDCSEHRAFAGMNGLGEIIKINENEFFPE
jgi:hypothetical protein